MLDKELCEMIKVDETLRFFVDYIDQLDDALEINEAKRQELTTKKEQIIKLRKCYTEMLD